MAGTPTQKPGRKNSTICLPVDESEYNDIVSDHAQFRDWLRRQHQQHPELFFRHLESRRRGSHQHHCQIRGGMWGRSSRTGITDLASCWVLWQTISRNCRCSRVTESMFTRDTCYWSPHEREPATNLDLMLTSLLST